MCTPPYTGQDDLVCIAKSCLSSVGLMPLPLLFFVFASQLAPAPPPLPAPAQAPSHLRWPGGEQTIERLAIEVERSAERGDPRTLGRLYRLWNWDRLLEHSQRVERSVLQVKSARGAPPLARAHATHLAAQLAFRKGDLDRARALFSEIGLITDVALIGPFDNSAGQGHETQAPPELGGRIDQPVAGKSRTVRWRKIGPVAPHGVLELSHLVAPSSEASVYVAMAVEADRPTPAAIRTGSIDQLRVFLDG